MSNGTEHHLRVALTYLREAHSEALKREGLGPGDARACELLAKAIDAAAEAREYIEGES